MPKHNTKSPGGQFRLTSKEPISFFGEPFILRSLLRRLFYIVFALFLLSTALYISYVGVTKTELSPEDIKSVSTIFSGFAFVVAAGWAIVTYTNSKRLEFQRYFAEQQVAIALETANAVGNLVDWSGSDDTETKKEWNKTKGRFWELYWGRLVLFEDEEIIKAMIELGEKLNKTGFEDRKTLKSESYAVSVALRKFLETRNANDWRITFADIGSYEFAKQNLKPLRNKNEESQ